MTTNARTFSESSCHWYNRDGTSCYELPKADGKGMKKPTLADARKLNLLPSVTTILRTLAKPELQAWIVEQAVLAVVTTPRQPGEADDAFVHRVLHVEKVQEQERNAAADLGTDIHDACEAYFTGQEVPETMKPWIMPAVKKLSEGRELVTAEKPFAGEGYGGRIDLILESPECFWVIDFKSTKKVPEKAYAEHKLQLAAYAAWFLDAMTKAGKNKPVRTSNCHISTVEQGKFAICDHDPDWQSCYNKGFRPLFNVWCYMNGFYPSGQ